MEYKNIIQLEGGDFLLVTDRGMYRGDIIGDEFVCEYIKFRKKKEEDDGTPVAFFG